jgi:hypothetical protein
VHPYQDSETQVLYHTVLYYIIRRGGPMCMRAHERERMRGVGLFTTHAMITNRLITVRTLLLPSPHRARCGHCCSSVARMALTSSIYCSLGTALVVRQFSTWGRHRREGGGGWGWGAGKMCQVCLAVSVPLLSTVICTVCRIVCKSVLSRVTGSVFFMFWTLGDAWRQNPTLQIF